MGDQKIVDFSGFTKNLRKIAKRTNRDLKDTEQLPSIFFISNILMRHCGQIVENINDINHIFCCTERVGFEARKNKP